MKRILVILGVALLAAAAFWAGRITMQQPAKIEQHSAESLEVEVRSGTLGRTLTLTTTVTRPTVPLAVNRLSGTLTQVGQSGQFKAGDLLYTVGGSQVRVVAGTTPFYRDLADGAQGEDVAQLQRFLASTGQRVKADGKWGPATTAALKQWQRKTSQEPSGTVQLGTLVASSELPVTLTFDQKLAWQGAVVNGGEVLVTVAGGTPSFAMEVTRQQAQLVPIKTVVTVRTEKTAWKGQVSEQTNSETGVRLIVTAPDGSLLCGSECSALPANPTSHLLTSVELVPPATGSLVPAGAITTQSDGKTTVALVAASGTETREVKILAMADGLAVVTGVEVGQKVRVFAARTQGTPVPTTDEPSKKQGTEKPTP